MEYLFDDVFLVKDVDHDGKKFDKVSRIQCRSEHYDMDLILDVATDIYPMKAEDRFHCVLSSTLSTSTATPSSLSTNGPSSNVLSGGGTSLADRFDYVMHGKIYKAEEAQRTGLISSSGGVAMSIFVSFGGLLMRLTGDPRHWRDLKVGESIYILIRKI